MMKLYDTNYKFLELITSQKDFYSDERLDTGFSTLSFKIPYTVDNINNFREENYIETIDAKYVIKEIIMEDNNFIEVHCGPNLEQLQGRVFPVFDCFEQGLGAAYKYCLSKSEWELNYQSQNKAIVSYQTANVSGYDMIRQIAEDYGQELWFDTKNQILNVYDQMGTDKGILFSNQKDLKSMAKQAMSYDYATVVYPIGKNGLTIKDVNNGKDYLENYSYSNKQIETYYIDEDITIPEILKQKGEEYLNKICFPQTSYNLSLTQLGNSVSLGDVVYIIDNNKKIKQKQRVVRIMRYPKSPEMNSIEISNFQNNFATTFVNETKAIRKELDYLKKLYNNLLKK